MTNDSAKRAKERKSRQTIWSQMFHSIRTRYSLATAFFLLACLGIFYVGGRIVLVHLMREAEQQVREIGYDISRLAYQNADRFKRENEDCVKPVVRRIAHGEKLEGLLQRAENGGLSLLARFSTDGAFVEGVMRDGNGPVALAAADLSPYADRVKSWIDGLHSANDNAVSVGIMQIRNEAHYVSLAQYYEGDGGYLILGARFDSSVFTSQVNEVFAGFDVRVVNRMSAVAISAKVTDDGSDKVAPSKERNSFGLSPMLSEAINFYSGGFWEIGANPFEAVFAIRDIAGNAVSMISVSLPATLANVTQSALGRLTFFIAMAGIFLIFPIFWFQSCVLLNPLTKMTADIRKLGEHHQDEDCPRLEWDGKDEFAMLAESVNRMLETISARAVKVAQIESRHRALIDGVPDALAIFDRRGRLVSVNKQPEGTDPLPGFAVGEPLRPDVFGAEGSDQFVKGVCSVFLSDRIASVQLNVQPAPGDPPDVLTRRFEVRVTKMDEVFALAIIRDTTQEVAERRRRIAAEKRSVDASKRESLTVLAGGIAHDVNSVLSVILNTIETCAANHPGNDVEAEVIRDAVKRGSRMTKELMEFAGDSKISLLRASPAIVVRDVEGLAPYIVPKNVALTYRLAEGLPDVDVDPNQFWKVLFNIIKNAGEAIGSRPGHILLSTVACKMTSELATDFMSATPLAPGPGVLFRIQDDGPGVTPEILARMFDPYVSSKSLGRGLGLATVRTIVETHGGGLKVESQLDHGTTFTIFLPESALPVTPDEVPPSKASATAASLPGEVLVVDDDEAILRTTSILLKILQVVPYVAKDRQEALAIIRRQTSRLGAVILDANFGGLDTVRMLKAIRIDSPDVPIVVCSGSSEEAVRKMLKGHSFTVFLAKPFSVAELKAALSACVKA